MFKVLIIDDDDQLNYTIREIFLEKGYAVKIARSGKEALNIASQENFDGIFIDIRLPDMNGMTLFKELKLKYPKSSYFLITGHGNLQNAVQAFNNGANGYYLKPLVIEDIIQRAQDLLEKKKLQQEIAESEKKYREAFIESEFYRDLLTHDF
ncbi:MAG: response regulator, partial [Promethearchaeota archaeon]